MKTYNELIAKKVRTPLHHGFEPSPLNSALFDWQKLIVTWAVKQGRCALFEDCGLGKTLQQLEWARQVVAHTGGRVLILCPLAVAPQTVDEGAKFGIEVNHCREPEQVRDGITITNYERFEKFDTSQFIGVVLDESSILKAFMGRTRIALTEAFQSTPYRLVCTATPSPNDLDELACQAHFLGVSTRAEMLATYFINDTQNTGDGWRLKKHAQSEFWKWVASWAACVSKPSDLGFSDEGFNLPPLKMHNHVVEVDQIQDRGDELFRNATLSATNIHKEMRITCAERVKKVAEIVNNSTECWAVWCNTNQEADELQDAIPDAVEIRGSDSPDSKEVMINEFSTGRARVIISKPSIAGRGLNWQHCHHHIFVGLSYSFEDFYQAMRRGYRFGQKNEFHCHIVQAETEGAIMREIRRKMEQHETMRDAMRHSAQAILENSPMQIMNDQIETKSGNDWTLHHGDCVRVASTMSENSVDFSVFSPPFADLFTYSADAQDMGNCASMDDFMDQFGFLVEDLLRVTAPGRLCAVHCADLMATKWKDGEIELKNFSGTICDAFRDRGWLYHTRITIWKDPVVEMQRTKALGLLHKQLLKDSAMSRVGSPEYVLVFRKPGPNANPVSHTRDNYPVDLWQRDASPVWMDVRQTRVLNGEVARDNADERHICPLQLDVIERLLRLYTNPGDLVFSPFTGIGSEGFCSVKEGRRFVGAELKESYWKLACQHLTQAENESMTLFNLHA